MYVGYNMAKPTITIGHIPILDHLALPVADYNEGKYFENFNLQLKRVLSMGAAAEIFEKGEVDGVFILFPLGLDILRRHNNGKVVLLGHREGQALAVEHSIHQLADLAGKTVFVPHVYSTHHILLHTALKQIGLQLGSDVLANTHYDSIFKVAELLSSGAVQGVMSAEPVPTSIQRDGKGKILVLSGNIKTHHADCVLIVRNNIIQQHPEAVQELIDSLVKAGMFINAYPHQAAEIGEKYLGWPKKILLEALTHDKGHIVYWDLLPRLEDFEELQRTAVQDMHLWDTEVDLSQYIDASFAQRAYREWTLETRKEIKDKGEARTLPGSFKESVVRLSAIVGRTLQVCGMRRIVPGGSYPEGVLRGAGIPVDISALLAECAAGREVVVETEEHGTKGYAFLAPGHGPEPQRVVVVLTEKEVDVLSQALHFGLATPVEFTTTPVLADMRPCVYMLYSDGIVCSIDYRVWVILPFLLSAFRNEKNVV
jgi:NitT/TauT family transport system substrate-binding protein